MYVCEGWGWGGVGHCSFLRYINTWCRLIWAQVSCLWRVGMCRFMAKLSWVTMCFGERVSCIPGWLWTHYVAKDKPKLPIFLSLSPDCRNYRHVPLYLVSVVLGIEPWALYLLGRHSNNWATSPSLTLAIFRLWLYLMPNSVCDVVSCGYHLSRGIWECVKLADH